MLQNHDHFGFFHFRTFSCKNASFIATGSRKTSAVKQQQLIPVWRKVGHCNLKLLAKNTIFQVSTQEGPKFMISHPLIQIYVRNISIEGKEGRGGREGRGRDQ